MKKANIKEKIILLLLVFVISGVFGFIYETLFYRIDLGYFVKRGSTFGPWIPIYGFGGVFIMLLTYRFSKNTILVFFSSMGISGILEYVTGYILDHFFNLRLWNYNTEIWNFGNINGYVCLRSILFFGLSGIFLVKAIIPFIRKYLLPKNKALLVASILGSLFVIDMVIYLIIGYN